MGNSCCGSTVRDYQRSSARQSTGDLSSEFAVEARIQWDKTAEPPRAERSERPAAARCLQEGRGHVTLPRASRTGPNRYHPVRSRPRPGRSSPSWVFCRAMERQIPRGESPASLSNIYQATPTGPRTLRTFKISDPKEQDMIIPSNLLKYIQSLANFQPSGHR